MIDRSKLQDPVHDVAVTNKLFSEHKVAFKRMNGEVLERLEPEIEAETQAKVDAAVQAERERLTSIAGHEEASGRETLALELACSGLDPEAALKILRETPASVNGQGLLSAAMQGYRPNVSADCADWEEMSEEERAANEILNA